MKKGQTVVDAINVLIPDHSLCTPEELRDLFVARPSSALPELRVLLQTSTQTERILFTGHRRCGKSSELAKLSQHIQDWYFIVKFSVMDRLNWSDLTYVDVLLSLGLEMFRHAFEQNVKVDSGLLDEFYRFLKETTYTEQTSAPLGGNFGGEINALIVKVFAHLKVEDATRREVREKVQPRLNELLDDIAALAASIVAETGKRVLATVEDLDKLDPETASQLFYGHGPTLARPNVSIIYTFPTALRHHENFTQIQMSFPNIHVLPNLKTWSKDNRPVPAGLALCQEILTRRVSESLFTPDALVALAENSGGIPGVLIRLTRAACVAATVAGKKVVDLESASHAVRSERRGY